MARGHSQNRVSIASTCEAAYSHHWRAPVRTQVRQTGTLGVGNRLLGRHERDEDRSARGQVDYTWDRNDCMVESPCGQFGQSGRTRGRMVMDNDKGGSFKVADVDKS